MIFATHLDLNRTAMSLPRFLARGRIRRIRHHIWQSVVVILGPPQLVRQRLDLGNALGRANTGDKMMTLVASALAGGDCIDAADVLRTGGTAGALDCVVKAPSTLGTFLVSSRSRDAADRTFLRHEMPLRSRVAASVHLG